ncbi:MAG: hypothetical protein QW478_07820 [Candidatus Micrarchaeaceae archaeon]
MKKDHNKKRKIRKKIYHNKRYKHKSDAYKYKVMSKYLNNIFEKKRKKNGGKRK